MGFIVSIPALKVQDTRLVDKESGAFLQEQLITVFHPDMFTPVQAAVLLDSNQQPYEIGKYELAADSIQAGKYGRPEFRVRIGKKLTPGVKQ